MIATCGIDCARCEKFNISCDGCNETDKRKFSDCTVARCCFQKGSSCAVCSSFPCNKHFSLADPKLTAEEREKRTYERVANVCSVYRNPIILSTERLYIIPLLLPQLMFFMNDFKAEQILGISRFYERYDSHIRCSMQRLCADFETRPDSFPWCSIWQIIKKDENVSVGSSCFHGMPGLRGEVEIGYGIAPDHRNHGYATEAVKAMIDFAFSNGVVSVTAQTDRKNAVSHRVLTKCGFTNMGNSHIGYAWHLGK